MEDNKQPGRKPTHRIYRVIGEGEGAIWTPVGAAWRSSKGNSFLLNLDAIPLNGRIVMQAITEKPAAEGAQQ